MPTETIITVAGVLAAFAFFATMLIFADVTADRPVRHKASHR